MNLNIQLTLDTLNKHLMRKNIKRSFIICGGASMILQGLSRGSRVTTDIDVVAPEIDQILSEAAIQVSEDVGLNERWLNSDPKGLVAYCDRQKDENDLIDLQISESELEMAIEKTKSVDANKVWPKYVEEQALKLRRKLGYG